MIVKGLLVAAAVALILSPTLRIVARWLLKLVVARLEAELRKAFPALTNKLDEVAPSLVDAGVTDMRVVLDLAAKLRDEGNAEAVKLCQQLLDQMLKPKA